MAIICILPKLILNDVDDFYETLSTNRIKVSLDDTVQACIDGTYLCKNGVPEREEKTEWLHRRTWQKKISGQKDEDIIEYKKWIEHDKEKHEYWFHPITNISKRDIDEQVKLDNIDFGNGFVESMEINGKKCSILVCTDDSEVEKLYDLIYHNSNIVE